ncbi:hypothetical protein [Vagococcus hydrophili]|uniref:Uncharacterized protein n=1 Tax=Vagococcus hydrophili TaxID=2714947 RepID=A0A6G8AW23_9ENTE|nr:hypothetical protein [Vagococcus hydrophili]QIL49135.1 hypothetical protein G7082_11870 [Vagococcus hydrophili]
MLNLSDNREHFRFPAYDDEIGVKLEKKRSREFLKDILDDGFVYNEPVSFPKNSARKSKKNNIAIDPVEIIDAPDYFGKEAVLETEKISAEPKASKTAFHEKKVKLDKKTVSIENKNTYMASSGQDYKSPQSSFSNNLFETDNYGNAKHKKTDKGRSQFESTYDLPGEKNKTIFKPKHIPASLIEDKNIEDRPAHNRELIVDELRKVSTNNLMLMEEQVVLDPVYGENFDADSVEEIETMDKKKNQRLEKTLSGIIEEEGSMKLDSYYFD